MNNLPSILGGLAQGFVDFGKSAVDLFGTGGASIADLIESAKTGQVTSKNSDDFRKWLYQTDDTKDAAAKGLGTALNGAQTVLDYIPGIGAVTKNPLFNAGQGALGGLADEFKTYGKDYDLGRAGQRAAISAGGALASSGLADALKKSANPLMSSGAVQGLARGATGGAISGGGYAAIDGGDIYNSALQGAGMGALIGGATGLAQDFKPAKTYDVELTDEEKAARIANIDDQLSKIDRTSQDGAARYDELMRARSVYDAPADKIQTLYHQTSADSFSDFSPEKRSAGVSDQGTPSGIFLKETDADIGLPGKNQLKFDVRMENPYEVPDRDALTSYARSRSKLYSDLYNQAVELDQKSANVYDEFTKQLENKYDKYYYEQDPVKKAELKKDVDYLLKNIKSLSEEKANQYRSQGVDVAQKAQEELKRLLKQDGYDSVILGEDAGSFGRKVKSYIALDPYDQLAEITGNKSLENTLSASDSAINNPKYVLDENGNPRTLYHGSPDKNITSFDINMAGKNTRSGEKALYFTDSPEVADEFSYERKPTDSLFIDEKGAKGRVYPVNLQMDNPLDLDNLTDAQIRELWDYSSPAGQLYGKEKFAQQLTDLRDKYHNAQLTKSMLDLEKLRNSQYDGFTARMYPNQENMAKEYAVFDNSKVKMLEDVLANYDKSINDAAINNVEKSIYTDSMSPETRRALDIITQQDVPVENELYNRIDPSTLPQGYEKLRNLIDNRTSIDEQVQRKLGKNPLKADVDELLDYLYPNEPLEKRVFHKSLDESIEKYKRDATALGLDASRAEEDMTRTKKAELIKKIYDDVKFGTIADIGKGIDVGDDLLYATQAYDRRGIRTGYPGALDTALSERLDIAPGNTIKIKDSQYDWMDDDYKRKNLGRYTRNAKDISVREGISGIEGDISTMAHERLHSFQNEARPENVGRYSKEVADAYNELSKDLKPYIKDNDSIAKIYGASDANYYASPVEQESRMLQTYLDNKGYTKDALYWRNRQNGGNPEWGNEINPAFDKFFDKLRDLSKRGVALPAIAALFGGGAYMASQDKEKEAK